MSLQFYSYIACLLPITNKTPHSKEERWPRLAGYTPLLYPLLTYLSRLINDIFVNSTLIRCLIFIQVQLHSKNFINFGCDNKKKLVLLKIHFMKNKFCAAFRINANYKFYLRGLSSRCQFDMPRQNMIFTKLFFYKVRVSIVHEFSKNLAFQVGVNQTPQTCVANINR